MVLNLFSCGGPASNTYDFGKAFTEYFNEYMKQGFALPYEGASEKEMKTTSNKIFSEKRQEVKVDYEGKAMINLTKKGDWIVDDLKRNQDFLNALSGGTPETSENMSNASSSPVRFPRPSSRPA